MPGICYSVWITRSSVILSIRHSRTSQVEARRGFFDRRDFAYDEAEPSSIWAVAMCIAFKGTDQLHTCTLPAMKELSKVLPVR